MDPATQVKHLKRWTLLSMLETDIRDRGIPWTELILEKKSMPNDLNLGLIQRWSVTGVYATLLFSLMAALRSRGFQLAALLGACCSLLATLFINRAFYAFLGKRRGGWFAVRAAVLHLFFYFYNGIAFLLGVASWASKRFNRRHRQKASHVSA